MSSTEARLSRKEIAAAFGRDRVTVYRWERKGLRLIDGRGTVGEVAWFLELRDAAKALHMDPRLLVAQPREVQTRFLAEALAARCGAAGAQHPAPADATSCNIAGRDSRHAAR